MRNYARTTMVVIAALAVGGVAIADNTPPDKHTLPPSPSGDLVVGLCDGTTSTQVKGVKPGQTLTPAQARQVADDLMNQWKKKNPAVGSSWDRETRVAQNTGVPGGNQQDTSAHGASKPSPPPAAQPTATNVPPTPQSKLQDGHTYGAFTTRDEQIWRASTQAFVDQGNKIFHDAKAVGGTIAVSCDMCHPNASNTHPETYPKYQVQLGRVAMLRDMINWCIENPARGKPLAEDDPRMKAMEAYIYSQRKGVPLEYGKH
jgi:thiosulfate dehydrogenase